jgi:organic radical activating enzyme
MSSILERLDEVQDLRHRMLAQAPAPTSLKIETTTNCNHNCSYCSRQYNERMWGQMSWPFYVKMLQQAKDLGVKQLGPFFLGEPFLIKDLSRWISEAKNYGFFVFLTTNGTAPTPGRIEEVMAAGCDSLKFSCNYYSAEQFAKLARVSPRLFHRIEDNIREARERRDKWGYKCELSASTIMYSGEAMESMKEYMGRISQYVDHTYTNSFYAMSVKAEEIETATGYKPNAGNPGRVKYVNGKAHIKDPLPCWSLWELHIGMGDWDDSLKDYRYHVSACCFSGEGTFNMGDLNGPNAMSLAEAWNSQKFMDLRQAHLNRDVRGTLCHSCIYG